MESRTEPPTPRRLRVDLADLADAFDAASWEGSAYLDLDTAEVVQVTGEVRRELEAIYDELPREPVDEAAYQAAFVAALERCEAPPWMRELLEEADAVEAGLGARFIRVPVVDSREAYEDMEAFIETIVSPRLQERLWAAIRGQGAFGRFRDTIEGYPEERERWYAFKRGRMRERVLAWLADEGIEPIAEAD